MIDASMRTWGTVVVGGSMARSTDVESTRTMLHAYVIHQVSGPLLAPFNGTQDSRVDASPHPAESHFSYYALDAGTGALQWKHEGERNATAMKAFNAELLLTTVGVPTYCAWRGKPLFVTVGIAFPARRTVLTRAFETAHCLQLS